MNLWIQNNRKRLENLKRILTESEYKHEFDMLPLRQIQSMLNGAQAEIIKLEAENVKLKYELKKARESESNIQ